MLFEVRGLLECEDQFATRDFHRRLADEGELLPLPGPTGDSPARLRISLRRENRFCRKARLLVRRDGDLERHRRRTSRSEGGARGGHTCR
jgi:hypothetical protein